MADGRIPAAVLVERVDFLLTTAYLEANAGNAAPAAKAISQAKDIIRQLRGAI